MNLEQYGIISAESSTGLLLSSLENVEVLLPIIQKYAKELGATTLAVAASLFVKRYAVSVAAASLDYFDFQAKQLNWLDYAKFDSQQFKVYITQQALPLIKDCWKQKVFYHLQKIIQILARHCKISSIILWENVAVRLNAVFKKNLECYRMSEVTTIFAQLTEPYPDWFFGQKTPLNEFIYICHSHKQRTTCCRYYLLNKKEEAMSHCIVCPLNK